MRTKDQALEGLFMQAPGRPMDKNFDKVLWTNIKLVSGGTAWQLGFGSNLAKQDKVHFVRFAKRVRTM